MIRDRVISHHLVKAVYDDESLTKTALIAYNVRGVGKSQGASAWVTPGSDPADFQKVEEWCIEILGGVGVVKDIRRLVSYSSWL